VWRTRWNRDPLRQNLILCACMHGGTSIYDISMPHKSPVDIPDIDTPIIAPPYKEVVRFPPVATPKQLAYGADWLNQHDGANISFVTSSFYENTVDLVDITV
jgi:hypothetical protein